MTLARIQYYVMFMAAARVVVNEIERTELYVYYRRG